MKVREQQQSHDPGYVFVHILVIGALLLAWIWLVEIRQPKVVCRLGRIPKPDYCNRPPRLRAPGVTDLPRTFPPHR
jgi:hypothetical protein